MALQSSDLVTRQGWRPDTSTLCLQANIFMGLGLLSMPYAMRLSGWAGLGALAVASALFCLSGRLLVGAFDQIPAHMSHTYPALGETQGSLCFIVFLPAGSVTGRQASAC